MNMTFEEITEQYLEQFGKPDQTFELPLVDGLYRQWFWYKVDVVAEFVAPKDDTENGWKLSFAMCLAPLNYYKKE
jgi:hypothetical protein